MNELRIIFMGTPEFAVPSLEALVENGFKVVAVVTAMDKPKGRGQKMATSPVKDCALKHDIPVLQPKNLKAPEFIEELREYNANLQVVVAFRMLPEIVWNMPEIGTFNLHASLLPQYRGAAPINWAIINGEKETGITTFFLKHEIDTGNILFQEKEPIYDDDTAGSLYERLMKKGAELVFKTARAIEKGEYEPLPQETKAELKHAPKIFKETCEINWRQPSQQVYDFVRGLAPYPTAWTKINGKTCKIYSTEIVEQSSLATTDPLITDNKKYLYFKTSDGYISVKELQIEGKKRMGIEDFLRGNSISTTSS
ncbi:methionyl-tRNA formyltransferase [Fulvivirgaceae bacterium BMA10]|uniref:Methionyl-tRNA formyltransferase n=1 Tax=Splendidivirga corallicola TaxID=3051826 RepID=A0ABT8KR39_9BACT|nr:methionyl-tRNA formyltransferase [Fulvivirgaceae bacterium BMA10]